MKTAIELLVNCPDEQIKRMQLATKAMLDGQWADAANYLRNAVRESAGFDQQWLDDCTGLAAFCEIRASK